MKAAVRRVRIHRIKNQIMRVFFFCGILPIVVLGIFGCLSARQQMYRQYRAQLSADVIRVHSTLYDITTTTYAALDKLISSRDCRTLFSSTAPETGSDPLYRQISDSLEELRENVAVSTVHIYTDNPHIQGNDLITSLPALTEETWYQAVGESWNRWACLNVTSRSGTQNYELCLVRRIALASTRYRAYAVVSIDRNDLKNRLEQTNYRILLSVNDQPVFYATDNDGFQSAMPLPEGYTASRSTYMGTLLWKSRKVLAAAASFTVYRVDDTFTINLQDDAALGNIRQTTLLYLGIALLSVIVPTLVILFYTRYFSRRVDTLKTAMHQASMGDYDIVDSFAGDDELRDIFRDLQITVGMVRDAEARFYKSLLNEQQLINRQQQMEFKMLASQINPHFLYNTLEMIRMQALGAGARDVATSIKLLGKSMHYVLETTGTQFTTLDRELDYVRTYLTIQQLRFGDRVDFAFALPPDLDTSSYKILPLLLQPLVENAVTHGLRDSTRKGLVTIGAAFAEGELILSVQDNGCGIPPETVARLEAEWQAARPEGTSGIALGNIHQRIRLVYGSRYGLKLSSKEGCGTCVALHLPYPYTIPQRGEQNGS